MDARETLIAEVSKDGNALQDATLELRGDRMIVMKAVSQNGYALQYAAADLVTHSTAICDSIAAIPHPIAPYSGEGSIDLRHPPPRPPLNPP